MKLGSYSKQYLIDNKSPIVIAVSGGPDSMLVCELVKNFVIDNNRDTSLINIAYYHHGVRSESDRELMMVNQYCDTYGLMFHTEQYKGVGRSERELRIARHRFFRDIMFTVKSHTLITGHNLTDRIETSLLNLSRGCQIKGFINMREIDINYYNTNQSPPIHSYMILRPLLQYLKTSIQDYCDTNQIVYMIDQSNYDTSISQRNYIRHHITSKYNNIDRTLRSDLYQYLENNQSNFQQPVRDQLLRAYCIGPVGEYSLEYLAWLFYWTSCYFDMTQGRLRERQKWIGASFQGSKTLGHTKWRIKHKLVYISISIELKD